MLHYDVEDAIYALARKVALEGENKSVTVTKLEMTEMHAKRDHAAATYNEDGSITLAVHPGPAAGCEL